MNHALKSIALLSALLISAMFVSAPGTCDVSAFRTWGQLMDEKGIVGGYLASTNVYPPLTSALIGLSGRVIPGHDFRFNSKLCSAAMLLLGVLVILAWTRDIGIAALYAWAMLLNAAQGYTDSFYMPFLIGCLWALQSERPGIGFACYAVACFTKQLPLILAPFLIVYLLASSLRRGALIGAKRIAAAACGFLLVLGLVLGVYGTGWTSTPISRSIDPCLSGNTLNYNWAYTYWMRIWRPSYFGGLADGSEPRYPKGELHMAKTRDVSIIQYPMIFFVGFYSASLAGLIYSRKNLESAVLFSFLGYLSYVMFCPGVHENHWAIATMLAVLLAWLDRRHRPAALAAIFMANLNLLVFYGITGNELKTEMSRVFYGLDVTAPLAALFVVAFYAIYWHAITYMMDRRCE